MAAKYIFSLILYRIVVSLLSPLLLLMLLVRSRSNVGYRQRLIERFGFSPKGLKKESIVVHAASVGEVLALKPYIEQLLIELPDETITITTFTPTGSAQVTRLFGDRVQHCYLPLDIFCCVWIFIHRLKPKMMVFMETELWPDIVNQAYVEHIPLLLINGRLSEKSVRSYLKLRWLMALTLNKFDKILAQSEDNRERFCQLLIDDNQCVVSGNLKYDISLNEQTLSKQQEMSTLLPNERQIWLVASTHEGDEAMALDCFAALRERYPQLLLILVPRHPERFAQVTELCKAKQFITQSRSDHQPLSPDCQVWVIDTLGELMAAYGLADIVTIGGSFSEINGHNPLEPALRQKAIIVGPKMANFAEINEKLLAMDGLLQIDDAEQLTATVAELLASAERVAQLGANAASVVAQNQGASDVTLQYTKSALQPVQHVESFIHDLSDNNSG